MDRLEPALREAMPVSMAGYALPERAGLIVIDVVDGFCTPGHGPLAPPPGDTVPARMVDAIAALARRFVTAGKPVLALRDEHVPGRAEPPYPPHCERGSGDELLVAELRWLGSEPLATVMPKDCISAPVGAWDGHGNALHEWILAHGLEAVVLVGICTDICVSDAVVALLSARNHHLPGPEGDVPMLGGLRDVVVYEPGCATYDLPLATARALGLPDASAHPRGPAHHVGLWTMQARGAVLADALD